MPQDFLVNAPPWAVVVFWFAAAIFAALFMVAVPRLRGLLSRVTPAADHQQDVAVRAIGAAFGPSLDAAKVGHELERIGDALDIIADAAKSLAKSEETGQARMLEQIAEKLERMDGRR